MSVCVTELLHVRLTANWEDWTRLRQLRRL